MQKNKNVKNAKEYVKKVNIYIKSYKVTFNFLYLTKTSWCRFIIFIEESLILLVYPFCFNIRLNKCLQLRERSSILLVANPNPQHQ